MVAVGGTEKDRVRTLAGRVGGSPQEHILSGLARVGGRVR